MKYFVEIDHPPAGRPTTADQGRAFIEQVIFPSLDRAEQHLREGRIVAGGPVAGRIALRFIAEVDSPEALDRLVTSLPLWRISETRVTPLVGFADRRAHVQDLRQQLAGE